MESQRVQRRERKQHQRANHGRIRYQGHYREHPVPLHVRLLKAAWPWPGYGAGQGQAQGEGLAVGNKKTNKRNQKRHEKAEAGGHVVRASLSRRKREQRTSDKPRWPDDSKPK